MKKIHEIKKEREQAIEDLFKQCGVFFAFSREQFNNNKTSLAEGDKYIDIGAGGFMPKSSTSQYLAGMVEIDNVYKKSIEDNKQRVNNILYELNNHEAFYTGSIETTLDVLGEEYTRDEVVEVYKKYRVTN